MRLYFWSVLALLAVAEAEGQSPAPAPEAVVSRACPVTSANGVAAAGQLARSFTHGSDALSIDLPWPDGTVTFAPGGPGLVLRDGALAMKFSWYRGVFGPLTIAGHRLDGAAMPLRTFMPRAIADSGAQVVVLIFPTPGCWEVTGSVADVTLTFVTRVVKIGDGPRRIDSDLR